MCVGWQQVKADALPYKWQAVTMEYLAPPEWVPLSILAPVRLEAPLDSALPPPLSLQAWDAVAGGRRHFTGTVTSSMAFLAQHALSALIHRQNKYCFCGHLDSKPLLVALQMPASL